MHLPEVVGAVKVMADTHLSEVVDSVTVMARIIVVFSICRRWGHSGQSTFCTGGATATGRQWRNHGVWVGARLGGVEPPSAINSGVSLGAVREKPAAPLPFNCCEGVLVSGRRRAGESQTRRPPETRALGRFGDCLWQTCSATGSQRLRGSLLAWAGACGLKEEKPLPARRRWGRMGGCWPHTGGVTAIRNGCPLAPAPSVSRSGVALPQGSPSLHFQVPRPGWAPPR